MAPTDCPSRSLLNWLSAHHVFLGGARHSVVFEDLTLRAKPSSSQELLGLLNYTIVWFHSPNVERGYANSLQLTHHFLGHLAFQ